MPAPVMVVDDDVATCDFLRAFLAQLGYHAIAFENADEAVRRYHAERPAAVILDVMMPGRMDGLEALAALKRIDHGVPVIMLSGENRTPTVVQAMRLGASDFVAKPFEESELEACLSRALKQREPPRDTPSAREQLQEHDSYPMLFRNSGQMALVRDLMERVAKTDVAVLIRGEGGTGKQLVARALAAASLRSSKPFIKVDCAGLPADLLESELFGFERSAAGPIQKKLGKFESAHHGTLFLDEIGELSCGLQAKLLRVLQDGEFPRSGGTGDVRVDVRIVASTSRDLEQAVADRQFREDLFSCLNIVSIQMPPLRDRRDEIPFLSEELLKKYPVQYQKPHPRLSDETTTLFLEHDWPGNIGELENLIKRVVVLGDDSTVCQELARRVALAAERRVATAGASVARFPGPSAPRAPIATASAPSDGGDDEATYSLKDVARTAARKAERELILKMLQRTRWNRKETAEILRISYKALLYKIKENGLDKAS